MTKLRHPAARWIAMSPEAKAKLYIKILAERTLTDILVHGLTPIAEKELASYHREYRAVENGDDNVIAKVNTRGS